MDWAEGASPRDVASEPRERRGEAGPLKMSRRKWRWFERRAAPARNAVALFITRRVSRCADGRGRRGKPGRSGPQWIRTKPKDRTGSTLLARMCVPAKTSRPWRAPHAHSGNAAFGTDPVRRNSSRATCHDREEGFAFRLSGQTARFPRQQSGEHSSATEERPSADNRQCDSAPERWAGMTFALHSGCLVSGPARIFSGNRTPRPRATARDGTVLSRNVTRMPTNGATIGRTSPRSTAASSRICILPSTRAFPERSGRGGMVLPARR